MGVYDILPDGQQVKCWERLMREVNYGGKVPSVAGEATYSIALREGGYANIVNCKFISITDKPISPNVFDKWGFPIELGKIPSSYFFEKEK